MFDLKGYGPALLQGALLTLEVAFLSLALALLLGMLGASAKLSQHRSLRFLGSTYTTVIRGVPDLVLMLLIFFGGQVAVNALSDWLYNRYDIDIFSILTNLLPVLLPLGLFLALIWQRPFGALLWRLSEGKSKQAMPMV